MTAGLPKILEEFIFMSSENEITMSNVDQEWVSIIQEAKKIGLSVKEVKVFLDNKQT